MRHFTADSFKTRLGVIAIVKHHGSVFRVECPVRHPLWMRPIRISGTFWLVDIVAKRVKWDVFIDSIGTSRSSQTGFDSHDPVCISASGLAGNDNGGA